MYIYIYIYIYITRCTLKHLVCVYNAKNDGCYLHYFITFLGDVNMCDVNNEPKTQIWSIWKNIFVYSDNFFMYLR